MKTSVTIIVPVYGDWPSLKICIESLKQHVDFQRHRVLFANDCGPEADEIEKNLKSLIHDTPAMSYFRNEKNLGFVQNCNNAVKNLDRTENDILLLNSDTQVTANFLEEMLESLYAEDNIGTVSPRSNNATICTVPLSAMPQKGIDRQESYQLFLKHHKQFPSHHEVPTGHGFCLLIRRKLVKEFGLFDEIFGKGYGEEVDFCQRIKQHGWKCVLSNWSYVFHLEAKSFSIDTKAKLLEINNKIIRDRYPDYQQSVRDYVASAQKFEDNIYRQSRLLRKLKGLVVRKN